MSDDTDAGGTHALRTNQPKIDELEYFIEGMARILFGPEAADDFRQLKQWVPTTANVSLLIDAAEALGPQRDVAEDFQFVYSDLEFRFGERQDADRPPFDPQVGLFGFGTYLGLVERPAALLEQLEERFRPPLGALLESAPESLTAPLAAVNAYAWFELLGLPDLVAEFEQSARRPALVPDEARTRAGLERLFQQLGRQEPEWQAALSRCHYLLHLDYLRQLKQLLGPAGQQGTGPA